MLTPVPSAPVPSPVTVLTATLRAVGCADTVTVLFYEVTLVGCQPPSLTGRRNENVNPEDDPDDGEIRDFLVEPVVVVWQGELVRWPNLPLMITFAPAFFLLQ